MMLRFVLLLLISTAASASIAATTTATTPKSQCDPNGMPDVSYTISNLGETLTVTPKTFDEQCGAQNTPENTRIQVTGTEEMNFYILFTNTSLNRKQKVAILDSNEKTLSVCAGDDDDDDDDGTFCPPVVLLKNKFVLKMPIGNKADLQVVIVATSRIPYSYYAYSQLPAWAAVATVMVTFVFLLLLTMLCCCCILSMCRRRRRDRIVSSGHVGRRNVPNGPPVYSTANPVTFDLPPIYMVREEAPLPQKSPLP